MVSVISKFEILGGCRESSLPRVQGCPPILSFFPHEWGIKGVEGEIQGNAAHHSSPLFTLSDCPVTIAARSEARKAMVSATSLEVGNLPSG